MFITHRVLNLTRIVDFDKAIELHVEDSLSTLDEFERSQGRFCDIGTGGGFPGIPLAIVTGRQGTLLDSVQKKAAAVKGFVDELGLNDQLEVKGIRSEQLASESPSCYGVVVARAVSCIAAVEELATPLLEPGGHLIAMRGRDSEEDLDAAHKAATVLGLSLISNRTFTLPSDGAFRRILVFARVLEPEKKIPRRPGVAQKHPLGY